MSNAKRTIVVVEDDAEMGEAIQRLLSAAGYCATTFPSAEALLTDKATATADLFIFDVHLPGISGLELQRRLATLGIAAPVIIITAYDDFAAREEAQVNGAMAMFAKPFRGPPLLTAIAGALEAQ